MTQQRVFVSYVPTPPCKHRGAAQTARRATQPVAAVVAGALMVGGAVHVGGSSQSGAVTVTPSTAHDAEPNPIGKAVRDPLPYLAVVAVAPSPKPDAITSPTPTRQAQAAAPQPTPRPRAALAAPRRDLAGFLEDRGHSFAEPDAAVGAGDLTGDDLAPASIIPVEAAALAAAPGVSTTSMPAVVDTSSDPALAPSPAIELQTFPMIMVDGEALGAVTMRGDKIHLSSLIGLLKLKLPAEEFARLKASPAADTFVDLDTLHGAGIAATLDVEGERITLAAA